MDNPREIGRANNSKNTVRLVINLIIGFGAISKA